MCGRNGRVSEMPRKAHAQPASWRAFEDNEITHSAAHYLLAVGELAGADEAPRAADIGRHLGVTRAAASLQLRTLRERGFVVMSTGARLRLSRSGARLVARVASKREVVRTFLGEVLGVQGRTAEVDACKIEHLLSEESAAALVRLVLFLRSGDKRARAFNAAFRHATSNCRPETPCELCRQTCLLNKVASS